jgi:hypothetical protein
MGSCGPRCALPLIVCDGGSTCADPRFDPDNCGGCGVKCPTVSHGTRLCLPFGCNRACDPGFADCNGMMIDGCEAQLATDTLNCGSCGHPCAGCANGMCP